MAYEIRRVESEEWRELRALTLQALQDSPAAFSTSYADAAADDDAAWQERAAREAGSRTSATFVATADSGRTWVGMTSSGPLDEVPGHAHVHGVFVAPAHRGGQARLAGRLMDIGIDWARTRTDATWLTLGVHEDNERARVFYRRIGFSETGKIIPYALDPSKKVCIMGYDAFR